MFSYYVIMSLKRKSKTKIGIKKSFIGSGSKALGFDHRIVISYNFNDIVVL